MHSQQIIIVALSILESLHTAAAADLNCIRATRAKQQHVLHGPGWSLAKLACMSQSQCMRSNVQSKSNHRLCSSFQYAWILSQFFLRPRSSNKFSALLRASGSGTVISSCESGSLQVASVAVSDCRAACHRWLCSKATQDLCTLT